MRSLTAFACLSLAALNAFSAEPPKLKLDREVTPLRYAADLTVDPASFTFQGKLDIDVTVQRPESLLWINAKQIDVHSATIETAGKTQTAAIVPGGDEFLGLQFPADVPSGPSRLHFDYSGKVSPKNSEGIFQGRDGTNLYLFTQFEETDARRAFPCFDQPDFKTPWQLTLHVKQGEKAFSNTPQVSETPEPGGMKKVVFEQTQPLPSYLVAFAVGPFDVVPAGRAGKNHIPVRIIAPKGQGFEAKYAAEITSTLIDRLENYFGIPYPYQKMDCVAIPLTYGFGAMENAGLITFEQTILLSDPKLDTTRRQRYYASVAAHELAHQWFGDLVTLAWWDDTWLNEAFATWTSSKILAEWKPEWNTRLDDLNSKFGAMSEDSLVATRKIHQPIETYDDISNAFDDITYEKGAAVIRMFEVWVGEKQFQAGVHSYLDRYAYKNARMDDFLDAIAATGQPRLTAAFKTFLDQPGVPEISVKLDCANPVSVTVSQKRYLPIGSNGSTSQVWQIPVCAKYHTADGIEQECFLLDKSEQTFRLTKASGCPTDLAANVNASGYYIGDYDAPLMTTLVDHGPQFLDPAEQVTLLHDLQSLARNGDVKEGVTLGAVAVYAKSPRRQIVTRTEDILDGVESLVPENLRPDYARFIRQQFGSRAEALGWSAQPGDDADTRLLRGSLLPFVAVDGEDQKLQAGARRRAIEWLRDRKGIDPDMLSSALSTAAHSGDRTLFDRMVAELKKTSDRTQRRSIIAALGSFREPALVNAAHELVLDPSIDARESGRLLFAGTDDPQTQRMAFEFVKSHWDALVKRLPTGGGSDFGANLPGVVAGCDAQAQEDMKFFEERSKQFAGGPRMYQQAVEALRLCTARKAALGPEVAAFFSGK